ncbi:MAG: hypothetical protein Q4F99_03115, partial [bacterium]|nr:hypothetical protein [bacterium]
MKKTFLKSLLILSAIAPALAWSELAYFNRLAGDQRIEAGTYGDLTMRLPTLATTCATNTQLMTTAEKGEIGGDFSEIIKIVGVNNDTQTHTFMGWFKVADLSTSRYLWWGIGGAGTDDHSGYAVQQTAEGKLTIGKIKGSNSAPNGWVNSLTTTNAVFPANTWVHVAIAITSDISSRVATPVVYINGKSVDIASGTFGTNLNGSGGETTTFYLGQGVSAAGIYVDTEALSLETIKSLATDTTYLSTKPLPVYLFDAGETTAINVDTDTWVHLNKNGSYPAFLAADTTYGTVSFTSSSKGNFFTNNTAVADNLFSSGTYVGLDEKTYGTVFEEMAATLGLTTTTVDPSIWQDSMTNGGQSGHTITISGLDTEKNYVLYYIGGGRKTDSTDQVLGGFQLKTYGGSPKVAYVVTRAGNNTSVATTYQTPPTITTAMTATGNGYLLVRAAYIKPDPDSGKIEFDLSGARSINCLAIAEVDASALAIELGYERANVTLAADKEVKVSLNAVEVESGAAVIHVTNTEALDNLTWTLVYGTTEIDFTSATFDAAAQTYTLTFNPYDTGFSISTIADLTRPTWLDASVTMPTQMLAPTVSTDFAMGQTDDALQTLSDGTIALIADFTTSGTVTNVYGGRDESTGGTLARNLISHISSGTYTAIFGGSNSNAWQNTTAHNIDGNILVDMAGGTANYVFGGNWKDGYGPTLQSNIDVVVRGDAVVKGSIFGGGISCHNNATTYGSEGEPVTLNVFVKNVQNDDSAAALVGNCTAGTIGGADVFGTNYGQAHKVYGDTAVTIDIPDTETEEKIFTKHLTAGFTMTGGTMTGNITGDTSVTVSAPNNVTFEGTIAGASHSTAGAAAVAGDASVTINGGTFTGALYAGGRGSSASVAGSATMTLNGGVFGTADKAATLAATDGSSSVTGEKILNIGAATFTNATITGFDKVNLTGNANLGAIRFGSLTLTVPTTATTLTVVATAEEVTAGVVTLGAFDGSEADIANLTITATIPTGMTAPAWEAMVKGGSLVLSATVAKDVTWQTPTSGTDWYDGLADFELGDGAIFGTNNDTQETVTVPEGVVAKDVTIEDGGDYLFSGEDLEAETVTVEAGGTLTLDKTGETVNYVRLTISNPNGGGTNSCALAELILTKDGTAVAWPKGTTIYQLSGTTVSNPNWAAGGNESVNALIDKVYVGSGNDQTYTNPDTQSTGDYDGVERLNKWNPAAGSSAVIALGAEIDFDGYQLISADHDPRTPKDWVLEVSEDGTDWIALDTQTNYAVPEINTFYVYDAATRDTIFPVFNGFKTGIDATTVTIDGTIGDTGTITADTITFGDGSTIAVSGNGPLTLVGDVTVTDKINVTVPTDLDAARTPFLVTADEDIATTTFSTPATHTVVYEDGIYYVANASKELHATITTETATWADLVWKDAADNTVNPDFAAAGDYSVTLEATVDTTLKVGADVTLKSLTMAGPKALTLDGSKITAEVIHVTGGQLVGSLETLPLTSIEIAKDASLKYVSSTVVTDPDTISATHAMVIGSVMGEGTFIKAGEGALALFGGSSIACPMQIQAGELLIRGKPAQAFNFTVENGARINLAAWLVAFDHADNKITLKGGGELWLTNGADVAGTITVADAATTSAKICGTAFNAGIITANINGTGKLEFAKGGTFGVDKYPCNNATTYSGVISGEVQVIVSDDERITFGGANTYTGGTEIAAGSILQVGSMANLGASGDVDVLGAIDFRHTGDLGSGQNDDWKRLIGTGTVIFNGNGYRLFPTVAKAFATTLGVENNLETGLILPEALVDYQVGSLSGKGAFRVDYDNRGARTLEIIQSKNTTYSGVMLTNNITERLSGITLSGMAGATEKTLTYSGTMSVEKPLTISESGALNLTGSWAGAITVSGTLGGSGTVSGALTYNSNATIDMTSGAALTANGTVVVPADAVTVVLGEVVASDLQLIKATTTNITSTEMPMATVKIGDEVITTVRLEKRADGLYLPMKQIFTRTFDGTATTWEATGEWGIKDSTATADIPLSGATIELTMGGKDTVVSHDEKIHVGAVDFMDEGHLILEFDLSAMMDDNDYLASPYTVQLLEIDEGVDAERVRVWTTGVKYGASVTLTTTETTVSATVSLPNSMIKGYEYGKSISINFKGQGNYVVSGMTPVGVAGYEVLPQFWSQFGGQREHVLESDLDIQLLGYDGVATTVSDVFTYWCNNNYDTQKDTSHSILRGYLDDGGAGATVEVKMPTGWDEYTAIIYCATDTVNRALGPKQINGMWYTYDGSGTLVSSADRPDSGWGTSDRSSELIVGTNVMIVEGLTGDFKVIGNKSGDPRGGIAAVQLVRNTEYDLSLAPTIYTATIDTDTAWGDIEWMLDGVVTTDKPTADDIGQITLMNDVTLDVTGMVAGQVSIIGRNHTLRLDAVSATDMTPWAFDSNTTLALDDATDLVPSMIASAPGRIVYNYAYVADHVALVGCTTEFTKGFTGALSHPEGSITECSGGTVSMAINQAQPGKVIFSGTATVAQLGDTANVLAMGAYEVLFKDTANASVDRFLFSVDRAGPTTLTMEDNAAIYISGGVNEDSDNASFILHGAGGEALFTMKDNAKILAPEADLLMNRAFIPSTIHLNLQGGELRTRGVKLSASAINSILNLQGGQLLIGEGGMGRYNTNYPLTLNLSSGSFGAFEPATLGAEFNAIVVPTVTGNFSFAGEDVLTLTSPALLANDVISVTGGGLDLSGTAFVDTYTFDLNGGQLIVSDGLNLVVDTLTMANAGSVRFAGGTVTVTTLTLETTDCTLEIPLVSELADTGHLIFANGVTMGDLSGLGVVAALDPDRASTDRLLPHIPVILGTADGSTVGPRSVSLKYNTNNAVTNATLALEEGSLGQGYYLSLEGAEVMSRRLQSLTATPFTFTQNNAITYPYVIFTGTDATTDNLLSIPENGLKLYQVELVGEAICLTAGGSEPQTLLQVNGLTIGTDVTFDLSAWKVSLEAVIGGAVKDVPLSYCLVAGGSQVATGVNLEVVSGLDAAVLAAEGLTEELVVTNDGIYYVVRGETRLADTISVNFTNTSTPLVAPPATLGAYAIGVTEWTSLTGSFSTPELYLTNRLGTKGIQAKRNDIATRLVASSSVVRTDASNPVPLRVWTNDAGAVTLTIEHVPFEAYRVALIFSADMADAVFARATVNGQVYAMDGEGYTRANVNDYIRMNGDGSAVSMFVPGDAAWGLTKAVAATDVDVLGVNTLVTDVFTTTDEDCTAVIEVPALTYGQIYAGIAAIQLIEAPALDTSTDETYSYTFTAAGDYDLATLDLTLSDGTTTAKWSNGAKHNLLLTVADAVTEKVTITLPYGLTAKDVTVTSANAVVELVTEGQSSIQVSTLNAGATKDLVLSAGVAGTLVPPTTTLVVNAPINNNGAAFTIPAGLTMTLTEASKMSTTFDSTTPLLTIDAASAGTLRINYPVKLAANRVALPKLTAAFKNFTGPNGNNNTSYSHLVEEGDTIYNSSKFHMEIKTEDDWTYTQTGGTATFSADQGNEGGMLLFNGNSTVGRSATMEISGGRLNTTMISAWQSGTSVDLEVSGSGVLALGARGFHANAIDASIDATISDTGTLELAATSLAVSGGGSKIVTFAGGRITTTQATTTMTAPVIFAGTEAQPTIIDVPATSTLVLNAVNMGTGHIAVPQGTLAIANKDALGNATVTIAAGAAYEVRNLGATDVITGTVTFNEGSILKLTTTETLAAGAVVRIAGTLEMSPLPTFFLNGVCTTITAVDTAAGTIKIGDTVAASTLTWKNTIDEGTWAVGVATPWTPEEAFKNGDTVTFLTKDNGIDGINVKVRGAVAPAAMSFASGVSNTDAYTFTAEGSSLIDLSAMGVENAINLASGVIFDVPVKTSAVNPNLNGILNTYRLIGSINGTTATLVGSGNINGASNAHGTWCTDGATLAPRPGEIQRVSAFGSNLTTYRSHLTGTQDVTITGGGTVEFGGNMGDGGAIYQNKIFSGKIHVTDGSTLDVKMTRQSGSYRDDCAFFALTTWTDGSSREEATQTGAPRWTLDNDGNPQIGMMLTNGGKLRVSGCRSLFAGWDQVGDAKSIQNTPLAIGYKAFAEFAFNERENYMSHGILFNGDGATLSATKQIFVPTGASFVVAGIGDAGDKSDPRVDTTMASETKGLLMEGIHASITGILSTYDGNVGPTVNFVVGDASTLSVAADVVSDGSASKAPAFTKTGAGYLSLEADAWSLPVRLTVEEGTLGGYTTMQHASSQVTMAAGTTIEAGLSLANLTLRSNTDDAMVTLAVDPTGATLLHADAMTFTETASYRIDALPGMVVPEAVTQLPVKVVSWTSAQNADTATFILSDTLTEKGYGLIVRTDGLYLAKLVVYSRTIEGVTANTTLVSANWYETEWTRDGDSTLVDYAPAEGEAVIAQWVLPEGTALPPVLKMSIRLTREVEFSEIRVVRADGTEFEEVFVDLSYDYVLTNEVMPEGNDVVAFTWVPTLLVNTNTFANGVTASGYDSSKYAVAVSKTTVTLYTSSSSPVLNISFGEAYEGDTAWLSGNSLPCGAVPFAGTYWNNTSTSSNGYTPHESAEAGKSVNLYSAKATVAGLEADGDSELTVRYAASASHSVLSRTTTANGVLTSTYIAGEEKVYVPDTLWSAIGTTKPNVDALWMVALDKVPFTTYDLYIIMAGPTDGEGVTYPPVSIKIGDDPWRVFSYTGNDEVGYWTAPATTTTGWAGLASPQNGSLEHGQQYLHLRVATDTQTSVLIAGLNPGDRFDERLGLAAIQIVECEDGPTLTAVGSQWSGEAWRRVGADGTPTSSIWVDATEDCPRPAILPVEAMDVDMPAIMPYLQIEAPSMGMTIEGTANYLRTPAIDLSLSTGGSVTFEENVFVGTPNVFLGNDVRVRVPEVESGSLENAWNWIVPPGVDVSTTELEKRLDGDLVLKSHFGGAWIINHGTLWADFGNATHTAPISGKGAFAKKGAGTLLLTGALNVTDETAATPVRVEGGQLTLDTSNGLTGIGDGKTVLATNGGTLWFSAGKGAANQTTFAATNGGRLEMVGNFGTGTTATIRLEDGGTFHATNGSWQGSAIRNVYVSGKGNHFALASNAGYGSGVTILGDFILEPGATLDHTDVGGGALRIPNQRFEVRDGAVLTTNKPLGVGTATYYENPDTKPLQKYGAGLWITNTILGSKGDGPRGNPLEVFEGEVRFALGGGDYAPAENCSGNVTVKAGAKLSGNVKFGQRAVIAVEENGTIASGVPGVATSKITAHTLRLVKGAIVECDLSKNDCLTVTNLLSASDVTIKLTNFANVDLDATGRRLIAWTSGTTISGLLAQNVTSAEAIALDATFEVVTTETDGRQPGLWLVPKDAEHAAYKRINEGVWSDNKWLIPTAYTATDVFESGKSARMEITKDVTLTADANGSTTVAALVMEVANDKTFTLAANVTSTDPVTEDTTPLQLGALWKLGAGDALITTPLKFFASTSMNVAKGTLTITKPLSYATTGATLPVAIDKGATLTFDIGAGNTTSLSDDFSGGGTLKVASGAITVGNSASVADHDV